MRPNILFIVMDDQRPDTIGSDSPFPVATPNLDRLAQEGTQFTRHYVTTPICTPARAELLTGMHSYHNGVRWFGQPIHSDLPLLPRWLQSNGYHTIHVGKWHNDGHPRDKGYDEVHRAMHDSVLSYREHGHHMRWLENGRTVEGHSTELFCDATIDAIQSASPHQPWFCYLALHSPHDPFQAPSSFLPSEGSLPHNFMPLYPWDNGDLAIRDELLLSFPREIPDVREYRRQYAGMIQHHDYHLGRIFAALRSSKEWDNTIIIFTSDHGLAVGDHGLLGKENMHEHSCRVPCVLRGPGVSSGQRTERLTHHTDIFPTICKLADLAVPSCDGRNMFTDDPRDAICCGFISPAIDADAPLSETQRMVVTQEWKYIRYLDSAQELLYHLPSDPEERDNLTAPWRSREYPFWGYEPQWRSEDVAEVLHELRSTLARQGRCQADPLFT